MKKKITNEIDVPADHSCKEKILDTEYNEYMDKFQKRFNSLIEQGNILFTTTAEGIFDTYLSNIPEEYHQYHNCHACRDFMNKYGGLAIINSEGRIVSAFWNAEDSPAMYLASIKAMKRKVERATITGVFITSLPKLGLPVTGEWTHFSVTTPRSILCNHKLKSDHELMAEKKEDFKQMARAITDYTQETIKQAISLLEGDALYRSEKVLGVANWLWEIHDSLKTVKGTSSKTNILWKHVAKAPPGFCHPRSSMIGTLLDDLFANLPISEVSRRFREKMSPLQYQRPQTAPTLGNIEQAEKIVEKLGIKLSLQRRFAKLEEINALWRPEVIRDNAIREGLFGHLKAKIEKSGERPFLPPATKITFDKFKRTVLPKAISMEILVPEVGNFSAILTATHPEAPPILQWDQEDYRNPFSQYVWHGGSHAIHWKLSPRNYARISSVSLLPYLWKTGENLHSNQPNGVIFIIEGAQETRKGGLAIFPEILKSELRDIRATIEAYSRDGQASGMEEGTACGLLFSGKDKEPPVQVVVKTINSTGFYMIDRWD